MAMRRSHEIGKVRLRGRRLARWPARALKGLDGDPALANSGFRCRGRFFVDDQDPCWGPAITEVIASARYRHAPYDLALSLSYVERS